MKKFKFFKAFLLVLFLSYASSTEESSAESFEELDEIDLKLENGVVKYNGAQLWRIFKENESTKNVIDDLQKRLKVTVWGIQDSYDDLFVKETVADETKRILVDNNVKYDVVIEDIQNAIDLENPPVEEIVQWQVRNGHPMTWDAYHRLADIHNYLDYLAATYPDLCSVQSIGKSFEDRDLKLLKISNGNSSNQAFWIDGGIHAREWISPSTVTYIINEFVENWEDQPDYIKNIDWYFLPVQNPDGYEFTHTVDRLWRKNRRATEESQCKGIDLNRNYGYKWGGQGTSSNPCSIIYRGTEPFSEPETRAVKDFFEGTKSKFLAFLSFHSYGQYILYSWSYDRILPEDYNDMQSVGEKAANELAKLRGTRYKVGPSASTLYPASGASFDWTRGVQNIKYSYTIELGDTGRLAFLLPAKEIKPTGEEILKLIYVMSQEILRK